jgi:chemotaxis protein CheD
LHFRVESANEKIRVVAQSILDIYPRKIYFFPATGKVMLRKLKHANNDTIIEREAEYGSRLRHADIEGDIDLF